MNTEQTKRTLSLLEQTKKLLSKQERQDLIPSIEQAENYLIQREQMVLVCGEFKRGKSSLIGAMLEQTDICPVDIDIATAVVSIISYGNTHKVFRYFGEIGGKEKEEIPFDQISAYATGRKIAQDNTWLLEIQVPCDLLKNGLVLIDTPGLGGLDPRHGFLTSYFMPQADVVLFTVDAGEPLSDAEITFLKEKVSGTATQIIIVLNKIDKVDSPETLITDIRNKVGGALGDAGTDIQVIPVSSKLKIDYLRDKDEDDLNESNLDALMSALSMALQKQDQTLVRLSIQTSVGILNDLRAPLIIQIQQAENANAQDTEELQDRCKREKERVQKLLDPSALWRTELSQKFSDLRMKISASLKMESIELSAQKKISETAKQSESGGDPNLVLAMIEESITDLAKHADRELIEGTKQICLSLQEDHGLSISDDRFLGSTFEYEGRRDLNADIPSVAERTFTYLRQASFGATMGAGVGWVIATIANPVLGVGAALFMIYQNIKFGHTQLSEQKVRNILSTVSPEIQKALISLNTYIEQRQHEIERAFKDSTQQELEHAKARYQEIAKALEFVLKRDAEERKALDKIIKTKLEPIEQLIKYFKRLAETIDSVKV